MQRSNYGNPPPATSPPLHHPVPQHVSTVPQLRSPPPPVPQQQHQSGYGNPYQPQAPQGASSGFGAYGGFINDPTAQMGFQVGQTALKHGSEYVEQNVGIPQVPQELCTDIKGSSTNMSMSLRSNTTSTSRTDML